MPSGPRLAHREADQGVQVFSGFRVERKLRSEQKQRHQSPIPSPPAPFGANLGDKAAAPVEGRFRGGGVAIGHHEMPGRALDPSGSPPFPSWLCHGIQGATRAGSRPHTVEEVQAPFSDPAGGGLPRPPCHLPAEGSDNSRNNSWSRGPRRASPAGDKMGTDRKQLLTPRQQRQRQPRAEFENLQLLLSLPFPPRCSDDTGEPTRPPPGAVFVRGTHKAGKRGLPPRLRSPAGDAG